MKDFEYKYKVLVRCVTYNQSAYIIDALNGFTMQETNFPFVCTIIDDASTDGEQGVIRHYLQENFDLNEHGTVRQEESDDYTLVFARHKTNTNCFFVVLFLKYNHYSIWKDKHIYIKKWIEESKYSALCEGDDYWTDPLKLQKQVDFMDSHSDFSMCFHGADVIIDSGDYSTFDNSMHDNLEEREYTGLELARRWQIPTASMLYRSIIEHPRDRNLLSGDVSLQLQCAKEGRVYCMSESMSVYRRTAGGVSLRMKGYSILQRVDRLLAFIYYFPEFKEPFEEGLVKLLGTHFYSKYLFNTLSVVFKRREVFRYFMTGVKSEFKPTIDRLVHNNR